MPVRVGWYVEHRVAILQGMGEVTGKEMAASIDHLERLALARLPDYPIHLIQNRYHIVKPYVAFRDMGRVVDVLHQFEGWMVVYGQPNHKVLNFLTTLIAQLAGIKTTTPFETMEALWAFLLENDPSLPPYPHQSVELFSQQEITEYTQQR